MEESEKESVQDAQPSVIAHLQMAYEVFEEEIDKLRTKQKDILKEIVAHADKKQLEQAKSLIANIEEE